ncbi:MAG: CBS domain-containing protein [Proteobacteria bacterium]|nr:CBS domain-containing protein [Pseudomonadota bacterium]
MANRRHIRRLSEIVEQQDLLCTSPECTVRDVVRKMSERGVTTVLVIDDGCPCGIFTKRDLLNRVVAANRDAESTSVCDVMSADPICVDATETGLEAMRLMQDHNIHHLVVTGVDGKGYGILSTRDLTASELEMFQRELEIEKRLWEEL